MTLRYVILLASLGALSNGCAQDERFRSGELRATVNGVELAYEIVGNGEPVLFIPSVIGDSFEPLMGEAALDGYTLIKYHQRGMGHSGSDPYDGVSMQTGRAQDAAALLHYLDVERAHVVGHSSAAYVAMRLAIDEPRLVHSLVLLDGNLTDLDVRGPEFERRLESFLDDVVPPPNGRPTQQQAQELAKAPNEWMMIWLTGVTDWEQYLSRWIPDIREQFDTFYSNRERPREGQSGAAPFFAERSEIESVSQPSIYVLSEERSPDGLVHHQRLQELLPQLETAEISGVGHGLHLQDPTAVAEVIGKFLADHPMQ